MSGDQDGLPLETSGSAHAAVSTDQAGRVETLLLMTLAAGIAVASLAYYFV